MKNSSLSAGAGIAAVALLSTTGPSLADATLLNLRDPPQQSDTPYTLRFRASSSSTSLTIEGYKVGAFESERADNIGVFLSGATNNLLGSNWTLNVGSAGNAVQFSDSSSVSATGFSAGTVGSYDYFGQTFSTTVGRVYTVTLDFTNPDQSDSGFSVVTTGNALGLRGTRPIGSAVPEPSNLGDDARRLRGS